MTSGYHFRPMNDEEARAVVAWRYEPPYDFYDMANDPGGLEDLLGPPERRRGYYAVRSEEDGELVGFFCFGPGGQLPSFDYADDGSLDIGLGLRPDLTGRGLGLEFLLAGLEFGRRHFAPAGFRLAVATFNERAILVYERAGFQQVTVFTHHTNGDDYPFLLMTREA
jgi:[ribosomal protein S18]-alanine N-acetyltransferase